MFDLSVYKKAMKALASSVHQAELNAERQVSIQIGAENGEVSQTSMSDLTELYVRVSGEKTGYAYTQDLTEEPQAVFRRAIENAGSVEREGTDKLNTPGEAFCGPAVQIAPEANVRSMAQAAVLLEKAALSAEEHVTGAVAEIRVDRNESAVLNSLGVDVSYARQVCCAWVNVAAKFEGGAYNTVCQVTAPALEMLDFDRMQVQIRQALLRQYEPASLPSGEYPVILHNTVAINILMTAWQLFSGLKYNEGSSALAGRLGQTIGSGALNISDVPSHPDAGYIFPFDCEGTPTKENMLVERGKLTGLMHNLASGQKAGVPSTANAGRYALLSGTIPTDIIIIPHIFHIKPGTHTVPALIKKMGNGVYITESYDVFHSVNIGSGDFSIPCKGVVIRDGKEQQNVTALTINGNLLDLFQNVEEAADDLLIEEFLRKTYCVGSPSLYIHKMQVNGK